MKKVLLALVAVSAAGYGVYQWQSSEAPAPATSDSKLVQDRLWIDHIPRSERDTIQIFAALTEQPVGVFQASSVWRGQFELFKYEAHGEELRVVFPQDGAKEKLRAKATRCNKAGMDFCLELDGSSRGVKKYYSREGWEIGSVRELDALKTKLLAE
jgi:hypothetical protein